MYALAKNNHFIIQIRIKQAAYKFENYFLNSPVSYKAIS